MKQPMYNSKLKLRFWLLTQRAQLRGLVVDIRVEAPLLALDTVCICMLVCVYSVRLCSVDVYSVSYSGQRV
jgi:hypothetical protein